MAKLDSITADSVDDGWDDAEEKLPKAGRFPNVEALLFAYDNKHISESDLSGCLDMFVRFSKDSQHIIHS